MPIRKANKAALKGSLYVSPFRNESDVAEEERERLNAALKREAKLFFKTLHKKRSKRFDLESNAAVTIQSSFRGFRLRMAIGGRKKRVKQLRRILHKTGGTAAVADEIGAAREKRVIHATVGKRAALVIQRMVRSFMAMRAVARERIMLNEEAITASVVLIQSTIRQFLAHRALEVMRSRIKAEAEYHGATMIQSVFRGKAGRDRAAKKIIAQRAAAANKIQGAVRCRLARKAAGNMWSLSEETRTAKSAIAMQRIVRGHHGRKRYARIVESENSELKEAGALELQRVFRGRLGRARWRTAKRRFTYSASYSSAVRIQALMRKASAASRVKEERVRQRADVFIQARHGNDTTVEDLLAGFGTDEAYTQASVDSKGRSVLWVAARFGHRKIARFCIKNGADVNHRDKNGVTCLMAACTGQHDTMAEYLLTKGATPTFGPTTELHIAARHNLEHVSLALMNSFPKLIVKTGNSVSTPMHEACTGAHEEMVRRLLDFGSSPNIKDHTGDTPLHLAARVGSPGIIKALIDASANPRVLSASRRTAWRVAKDEGHEDCAALLQAHWAEVVGGDVAEAGEGGNESRIEDAEWQEYAAMATANDTAGLAKAFDSGVAVDAVNENGASFLLVAAASGSEEAVHLCLDRGAALGRRDMEGRSILMYCAAHESLAQNMLARGASLKVADSTGMSPVHYAAKAGWMYNGAALASSGVDVNAKDELGRTALFVAAKQYHDKAVRALLTHGASAAIADGVENTPLHQACQSEEGLAVVKTLVGPGSKELGSDAAVDAQNQAGDTPLLLAIKKNLHQTCSVLIEAGAPASQADGKGTTAVHLAVASGNSQLVHLIVGAGGSVSTKDGSGQTPLLVAIRRRDPGMVKVLLEHGAAFDETYDDGNTALHVAACESAKLVPVILEAAGVQSKEMFTAKNKAGETPIESALLVSKLDSVDALREGGSKLEQSTLLKCAKLLSATPLKYALAHGGSIEYQDDKGRTALHLAAEAGSMEVIKMLVDAGTNLSVVDNAGDTALALAHRNKRISEAAYLREFGASATSGDDSDSKGVDHDDYADEDFEERPSTAPTGSQESKGTELEAAQAEEATPEPMAKSEEPEAAPEPIAKNEEPEAAPEPIAKNEEPEAKNEPEATPEPETQPEPIAKNEEPEAKNEEPEAKNEEPEAKDEEPEAKDEEPEAKDEEPEAKNEEPEAKNEEPEAKNEAKNEEPNNEEPKADESKSDSKDNDNDETRDAVGDLPDSGIPGVLTSSERPPPSRGGMSTATDASEAYSEDFFDDDDE